MEVEREGERGRDKEKGSARRGTERGETSERSGEEVVELITTLGSPGREKQVRPGEVRADAARGGGEGGRGREREKETETEKGSVRRGTERGGRAGGVMKK